MEPGMLVVQARARLPKMAIFNTCVLVWPGHLPRLQA